MVYPVQRLDKMGACAGIGRVGNYLEDLDGDAQLRLLVCLDLRGCRPAEGCRSSVPRRRAKRGGVGRD